MNRYVFVFVVSAVALVCLTPGLYLPIDPRWAMPALIGYGLTAWGFSTIGFVIILAGLGADRGLAGLGVAMLLTFAIATMTHPSLPPIGLVGNAGFLLFVFAFPLANILNLMQLRVWPPAAPVAV